MKSECRFLGFFLVGVVSLACFEENRALTSSENPMSAEQPQVISHQPTTFDVAISAKASQAIQRQLAGNSLSAVRLRISDLQLPDDHSLIEGIRVFVNKPDADSSTSSHDPHYAGSFVLGLQSKQSFLLNISSAVRHLQMRQIPEDVLQITFIAIPSPDAPRLQDVKIRFRAVSIEVPDQEESL